MALPTKHQLGKPAEQQSTKKMKTNVEDTQNKTSADKPGAKEIREAQKRAEREERERAKQLEKEKKEQERQAEKERKEKERQAEKERKERERLAEKERKEKERLAEKERKEKDRLAEKERKEKERLAEKERKEKEKLAEKERKLAEKNKPLVNQRRIAFTVQKKKPQSTEVEISENDYEEYFLPFNVKSNVTLFQNNTNENKDDPLDWLAKHRVPRGSTGPNMCTREVVEKLSIAGNVTESEARDMLGQLPVKYLHFAEDVRPPYVGTYCKASAQPLLGSDPLEMVPDLNYFVDSEAEWEEVDEGEDLESGEEEDDDEIDDDDDMSGFLDPEESQLAGPLMGDLIPVIRWNDIQSTSFRSFVQTDDFGIDVARDYWNTNRASTGTSPNTAGSAPANTSKKSALVPDDILPALLRKINGSDMNKTLLVELMHRDFPGVAKTTIHSTVGACAQRMQASDGKKRWQVSPELVAKYNLSNQEPQVICIE